MLLQLYALWRSLQPEDDDEPVYRVTLRWFANVYSWQWRVLLPLSAVLELAAFLIFARAVSRHRPASSGV